MGQCCAGKEKPPAGDPKAQNNPLDAVTQGEGSLSVPPPALAQPESPKAAEPDPNVVELQKQVAALTKMIADQQQQAMQSSTHGSVSQQPRSRRQGSAKALPEESPSESESEGGHNILAGVMESKSHAVGPTRSGRGRGNREAAGSVSSPPSAGPALDGTDRPRRRRPPPPPPQPAPPAPRGAPAPPQPDDTDFDFREEMYEYKGKTDPERVRTLLLIGETGSGKSTLVNAMANWAAGVKYSDSVRYRLVVEPAKDQAFSQTQAVTTYHVTCEKFSYVLRLIDTPGFGDTSGVERDEQITKDIYDTLQKEDEIHGVCFVAAASLPRLTVTQQYIINKVLTMFGTDSVSNIFLLVTFADGKKAQVLNAIKASGFPYNDKMCFHFNNSALFSKGEDRNEYSKNFWSMGEASMERFFQLLSTKEPFNLSKTKDVINTQKKLQNYVASITPQVTIGLSKMDNLKKVLADIRLNRDKINENKNYSYSETIPKVERMKKQPGTYNTQCLKCSYNCHHDCTRNNDDDKQYCCAMDAMGNCTVCPDHCHWSDHANLDYYFDWSVQVVTRQYDTKKLQLNTAKDGLTRSEALKNTVLTELQEVYDSVRNLMTSIHQAHAKLDEIALRPTNLQFADYLKLLIEQEKLHKRAGFEGRIEQLHMMLEQAKIQNDIVSKKYDPIGEWKRNVEQELEGLGAWEEPAEEPQIEVQEDEGDSGPSTSEDDDSSDDSDTDDMVYEGENLWQPRPTLSQLATPSVVGSTPLPPQEQDSITFSTPRRGMRTPASTAPAATPAQHTPSHSTRSTRRRGAGNSSNSTPRHNPSQPSRAGGIIPAFKDPNEVPTLTHDPQTGLWHTPSSSATPGSSRRGTRAPDVPVWDGIL